MIGQNLAQLTGQESQVTRWCHVWQVIQKPWSLGEKHCLELQEKNENGCLISYNICRAMNIYEHQIIFVSLLYNYDNRSTNTVPPKGLPFL